MTHFRIAIDLFKSRDGWVARQVHNRDEIKSPPDAWLEFDLNTPPSIPPPNIKLRPAPSPEAVREACAMIADTEEELDGDPPAEMLARLKSDPIKCLRAAVRSTKNGISKRIRALDLGAIEG